MLLHSPSGGLREHVEQEDIQHGILHLLFMLKKIPFVYRQLFAHIQGNHLIQRHHLLKAMHAVSKQGVRLMRLFGNENTKRIYSYVGPEQEYFLSG